MTLSMTLAMTPGNVVDDSGYDIGDIRRRTSMAVRREPPWPIPAPVSNALKGRSRSHHAEVCSRPSQGVHAAICAQRGAGHFKSLASGKASSARAE